MKAIALFFCVILVGCQSPSTTVIVPGSAQEVATLLHERFTQEQQLPASHHVPNFADEQGFVRAELYGLKMSTGKSVAEISFLEQLPGKASNLRTIITIKHHSRASSQVTILSARRSIGLFSEKVQRREDIEGLRMAQILRWIVPDGPIRFKPRPY